MIMMNEQACPPEHPAADADPAAVFRRLGVMTRQLHDALRELGVMPQLQHAAEGLPDARSRLNYVVEKTAAAADKVLDAVDEVKSLNADVSASARALVQRLDDPAQTSPSDVEVREALRAIEERAARADARLTDIMLAQDFHDLTGQVVARVVTLANELESSLVKLLVEVAPESAVVPSERVLDGPVVDQKGRSDVAVDQTQVDDLLASLGF
jgi:chemotaxis protein CheZ